MIAEVISILLEYGTDDWFMFINLVGFIRLTEGVEEEAVIRREALMVVNLMLATGWFECGEV